MADDEVRLRLVSAINGEGHLGCDEFSAEDADSGCPDCGDVFRLADALLPVVEAIAVERAAKEVEGWARSYRVCGWVASERRNRAVFPKVADTLEAGARDLRATLTAGADGQ